jgi:hypothetical protein
MKELFFGILSIFIGIAIIILLMFGTNSCTSEKWNNGICPECNIKYELNSVSNGMRYYECPECDELVGRY